jgi:hypothetical protein
MQAHLGSKEQVFQKECLHRCKYSTGSSLILVYAILYVIIKVKALFPGVMQVTFSVLEEQFAYSQALLSTYDLLLGIHL